VNNLKILLALSFSFSVHSLHAQNLSDSSNEECSKSECRIEVSISDVKGNQNWVNLSQLAEVFYSQMLRDLNFRFNSISWSGNSLLSGSLKVEGLKYINGGESRNVGLYWDNSSWSPSYKNVDSLICKKLGFNSVSNFWFLDYNFEDSKRGLRQSKNIALLNEDLSLSRVESLTTAYQLGSGESSAWYYKMGYKRGLILNAFTCAQ